MAKLKHDFLLLVVYFLLSEVKSGFLDFEELASVNYGIDIVDKPVVIGQEPQGAILLRSKYGQQYQCSYTDWEKEDERERLEQQEAIDTGIPELLRPLTDTCIVYPKDWWTYELCYGKHVKQYHLEDNTVVGNIIYLGHYQSEFDWNNITGKDKKRKYHTHTYTNGTICDLTNKPRRVEVRFECNEVETETIAEISEAQTCVYTLIVHTARLCKHPYLKKAVPAKPVPITCNPLISAAQYQEYLNTQQELDRRKDEEYQITKYRVVNTEGEENSYTKKYKLIESSTEADEVSDVMLEDDTDLVPSPSQDEGQSGDLEPGSNKEDDNTIEESQSESSGTKITQEDVESMRTNVFTEELIKEVMKVAGIRTDSQGEGQNDDSQKDESQTDVQGSNQEGQELGQGQVQGQDVDVGSDQGQEENVIVEEELDAVPVMEVEDVGNDEARQEPELQDEVDDDEKIMAEFDKELNEIVDTAEKKAHMELRGENIESAMSAKFSDIVDEAEEEMAQEGNPVQADRGQAFSDLAKTLTKLLSRLHRTERERRAVEKHLKKAQELAATARARKRASKAQDSPSQPAYNTATQDKTPEQAEEANTETNKDALSMTQDVPDASPTEDTGEDSDISGDVKDINEVTDDVTDDDGSSLTQLHSLNNRVRVRVTRIKHAAGGGDGAPAAEGAEGDKQTLQLPDEQRKELESTVKTELERAGLETKGQKIEVKIITAGYFDTNKEGVHVLSEEESSAFNNMIISILGGNSQAAREMTHQQRMEDAYTHVWGTSNKKPKSSSEPPAPPS